MPGQQHTKLADLQSCTKGVKLLIAMGHLSNKVMLHKGLTTAHDAVKSQ